MLFHLALRLRDLSPWLSWLNVVRYTSTRIIAATMSALMISFLLSPWFIRRLQEQQIGQVVRDDGPKTHLSKRGTPTMGGTLILFALVVPTLLWCDLRNGLVWLALLVTVGYGVVGFLDDYLKLSKKNPKGLPGKLKLALQIGIGAAAVLVLFRSNLLPETERFQLALPFVNFQRHPITLAWPLYCGFALLVVVGASNAVNLTDGLDGLAIGPVIISAGAFLVLSYVVGVETLVVKYRHVGDQVVPVPVSLAKYLYVPQVPGSSELAIFCGGMVGAGIGFLWYNTYPATVFMGDVGALALGGALGMVAVETKNEFTLLVVGGVFVAEAVSVMAQVISFKLTGKRIFKMAPIHHHFELKGWPEPKVIVRFWIVSFFLALIGLMALKVR
jgi:phospho-N-acetylmuramoyl-pentapeptide-transferase